MAGDKVDDSDDDKKNEEQTSGKVYNVKPPEMIKDGVNFDVYKQRLERWSRLSGLNPQTQFDLVMTYIDPSNELGMKLEREIGNSKVAKTEGVKVLLDKLEEWFGKEEEVDAFKDYKEFEEKRRTNNQDILEYIKEWESLYKKCKDRGDTFSDRVLGFKLMVSCNLDEMDHKLVFRESRSNENDGKIFERTKKAIRMFYNAGTLKSFNDTKVLFNDKNVDLELEDENIKKTLILKGWKAPKSTKKNNDEAPYTKWFKCRHCKCKCTPSFKRCSCPCSNHKSTNCPTKGDHESERKDDDPVISQVSLPQSQSNLGRQLNLHGVKIPIIPSQSSTCESSNEIE